jgi:hypothetical protein
LRKRANRAAVADAESLQLSGTVLRAAGGWNGGAVQFLWRVPCLTLSLVPSPWDSLRLRQFLRSTLSALSRQQRPSPPLLRKLSLSALSRQQRPSPPLLRKLSALNRQQRPSPPLLRKLSALNRQQRPSPPLLRKLSALTASKLAPNSKGAEQEPAEQHSSGAHASGY